MNESASNSAAGNKGPRFSLRQIIAVITSVAATFAVCAVLASPPLHSIGLREAALPALVLMIALWFCRTDLVGRLGTYAVVASPLAVHFFLSSIGDWLFGHTHGPPQFTFAAAIAGAIAAFSGVGWALAKLGQYLTTKDTAEKASPGRLAARWSSGIAVVLLTALGSLAGWTAYTELPRAKREVAYYLKRRQLQADLHRPSAERERLGAEHAEVMRTRPEIPGIVAGHVSKLSDSDPLVRRREAATLRAVVRSVREGSPQATIFDSPATKDALIERLDDDDEVARRLVAITVLELDDQVDQPTRLKAIETLGVVKEPAAASDGAVALERLLDRDKDPEIRATAIRTLGQLGPRAAPAAPRIASLLVEGLSPVERSAAAETLPKFGAPIARQYIFSYARAWQEKKISLQDAQVAYKIDPQAAAGLKIPAP